MALFYVGYLVAVSSTIAFIVAILTPRWIYPTNSNTSNVTHYRGIFFVDLDSSEGICRDWILLYKDSIANCRPRMYLKECLFPSQLIKLFYHFTLYF